MAPPHVPCVITVINCSLVYIGSYRTLNAKTKFTLFKLEDQFGLLKIRNICEMGNIASSNLQLSNFVSHLRVTTGKGWPCPIYNTLRTA